MTSTAVPVRQRTPRPFEFEGQILATRSGVVTVALQWTQVAGQDVYRVEVSTGVGGPVDQASYSDEQTARDEAYRMVEIYASGESPWHLEDRRTALRDDIYRYERGNSVAQAKARQLEKELDAIDSLTSSAWKAQYAASVRADLIASGTLTPVGADDPASPPTPAPAPRARTLADLRAAHAAAFARDRITAANAA